MAMVSVRHLQLEPEVVHGMVTTRITQAWAIRSRFVAVIYGMARMPVSSFSLVIMAIALSIMGSVRCWPCPSTLKISLHPIPFYSAVVL